MLRTLRGRLLWSFVLVILVGLMVVAISLFGFAGVSNARLLPSLERLSAISRTNQRELLQLWGSGAGSAELQGLLFSTSEQADVRILVVDRGGASSDAPLQRTLGSSYAGRPWRSCGVRTPRDRADLGILHRGCLIEQLFESTVLSFETAPLRTHCQGSSLGSAPT